MIIASVFSKATRFDLSKIAYRGLLSRLPPLNTCNPARGTSQLSAQQAVGQSIEARLEQCPNPACRESNVTCRTTGIYNSTREHVGLGVSND